MTYDSAYDIVKKYHHAWTSGDVEQAMECVADDIICHAPGGDLEGKDVYRSSSEPLRHRSSALAISPSSPPGIASPCFTTRRPRPPQPSRLLSSSRSGRGRSLRAC